MTWAKLDDQFHSHRKAKRAWKAPRALGLHMLAMSYCAGQLTDGLVDDEFVEEKIPNTRERTSTTDALVEAGLWTRETDGWRIHDWLEFNASREATLDKRRKESERKALGRSTQSARRPAGVRADKPWTPRGVHAESDGPDPTRPDHTTPRAPQGGLLASGDDGLELPIRPSGSRQRDKQLFEEQVRMYAGARFPDLPEPERSQAVSAALTAGATHGSVEAYVRRWLGSSAATDEPTLTDQQRDAIHTVGNRITEINDNATEAA